MTLIGILLLIWMGVALVDFAYHLPRMERLHDTAPSSGELPFVSILIPVRNEERHVETALHSVLALDYPRYEVVVLDDRSTDATPAILARMAAQYPQLQVRRIDTLPEGWLGKNHALNEGASKSCGEYLLFTDADVVYRPDTLRRAMTYTTRERAEFLAIFPRMVVGTLGTKIFSVVFTVLLYGKIRPWSVANPKSKAGVGIGAFSLVSRKGYEKLGTHEALRLYPDDDLELGRRAKKAKLVCRILDGTSQFYVPWYATIPETIKGFEKNFFSGLNFNVPYALFATFTLFAVFLWPCIAVFIPGPHQVIYALVIGVSVMLFGFVSAFHGTAAWYGLGYPFGVTIFIYALLHSMFHTLRQDGIRWRGTHYPLKSLRKARRPRL